MPRGKRYRPVVSQAQRRFLYAAARRGDLPMHEAEGKSRAAKRSGKRLPKRVRHQRTVVRRR